MECLREKKAKNASFSLRAYARQLGISPTQLSMVISGKRPLTAKVALKLADHLQLSPYEKERLLTEVHATRVSAPRRTILDEDQFRAIAEWYHFAILSLSQLEDAKSDPKWIARRLNIDSLTARDAFERLKRLGLIEESRGKFRQTTHPIRTTNDVPSAAIRKHHKQNLHLAAEKLDSVEVDRREYASLTIAIDPERLPRAKEMIRRFKEDLGRHLEAGRKSQVYTLSMQLFPVTEPERKQ
jgi:uncharacterized protein (TIGR02147 family)